MKISRQERKIMGIFLMTFIIAFDKIENEKPGGMPPMIPQDNVEQIYLYSGGTETNTLTPPPPTKPPETR